MSADPSVTDWIRGVKAGGEAAIPPLLERYFDRLVRLAASRLAGSGAQRAADEEDVALSAFHSFCRRAGQGEFDLLHDRTSLWPLLAKITVRKAIEQVRLERRQKRGGGKVRGESAWLDQAAAEDEAGIEQEIAAGPGPESVVAGIDECKRLLDLLPDPSLRKVALWKLEGHSNDEIARKMGVVARTVERKLGAIRRVWADEDDVR